MEEDGFSWAGFWQRRGSPKLSQSTGEVIEEAAMPHLALLARLYHGVEATSCQAERNFSALALLIGQVQRLGGGRGCNIFVPVGRERHDNSPYWGQI